MNLDQIIRDGQIDFLDFGCSKGGSIRWAQGRLGGVNGLGVDINPVKVGRARAKGLSAVAGDATALTCADGAVSFVTMLHFLEHLPSQSIAKQAILSACRIARDFVYMRHPWFGSDAELLMHGYKLFWSDWHGHRNHFGPLDIYKVIRGVPAARQWYIFGRGPITSTQHPALVPLDSPRDGMTAGPEDLQKRAFVPLSGSVFAEVACLIVTGERTPLQSLLRDHVILASSEGSLQSGYFRSTWDKSPGGVIVDQNWTGPSIRRQQAEARFAERKAVRRAERRRSEAEQRRLERKAHRQAAKHEARSEERRLERKALRTAMLLAKAAEIRAQRTARRRQARIEAAHLERKAQRREARRAAKQAEMKAARKARRRQASSCG